MDRLTNKPKEDEEVQLYEYNVIDGNEKSYLIFLWNDDRNFRL